MSLVGEFAVWIGIDWADDRHAVSLMVAGHQGPLQRSWLAQKPEAIEAWVASLRERFPGQQVAVCLEQSKGPLIFALMKYEFITLYPINPAQLASYRKALAPSGPKDDPTDADLLCEFLAQSSHRLRAWRPDTTQTRLIDMLARDRRECVDRRTALTNCLISRLKTCFPQALELISDEVHAPLSCAFLERWPTLAALQASPRSELEQFYRDHGSHRANVIKKRADLAQSATPLTTDAAILEAGERYVLAVSRELACLTTSINELDARLSDVFAQHPDAHLFSALPGAGDVLAPRLLAAMGSDRERFQSADDVQRISGVAPVIKRSGKVKLVQRRLACPKYLRQTFHEFAHHSCKTSAWAKAYYDMQRHQGKSHHTAIRSLAYKWIRIIYACWKSRTIYNEVAYYSRLVEKKSPLLRYLASPQAA
jgi:transposase